MGLGKELAGWMRSKPALVAMLDKDSGGTPRIHPRRLPQKAGQSPRAIVYHKISDLTETHMAGVVSVSHAIMQFDCYGRSPDEADDLRETLKKQLDALGRGQVGNVFVAGLEHAGDRDGDDDPIDGGDAARFIAMVDYRFSYQRPTV